MIRNCFSVYQVITRNTHHSVSETCPLCKVAAKSYLHMQMGCKQTKDARTKCHNMILTSILNEIQKITENAEVLQKPKVCDLGPCADARLVSF